MTAEQDLSVADIDQLGLALQQIATDMNTVKEIFGDAITSGKIDYRCASIEALASRAGALADRSIQTLGGIRVRGNFEEWFED